ncbi:hypothetical protein [Hyphomicrobium sp.]|uniref:hypothetical protein n=1 Tax=Hyphomicrobium sp. TaxID=82 RepID=UPI002E3173C0|nr:hypothetical protein [Hyphomicrobium sp.]HEX2843472.1 hypothetical protein [Hyphomicrobium sp.]
MSLTTRVVTALAVLSVAAIPVGALTIKNKSSKDVSAAVDNGNEEAVYQIPAGGSVEVKQDCSSDCAVTGPWGYSRLVSQNDAIETDGTSLVTAIAAPSAPASRGLVPQNPVADPADAAASDTPVAKPEQPKRSAKPRRAVRQAQKGPTPGTFEMLMQPPKK